MLIEQCKVNLVKIRSEDREDYEIRHSFPAVMVTKHQNDLAGGQKLHITSCLLNCIIKEML